MRDKRSALLQIRRRHAIIVPEGGDQMKIGENIRALRLRKGLTQEQVAQQLGVTYQAVSKWENGVSHS